MVKAGLRYRLSVRSKGEIRIKCNPENLSAKKLQNCSFVAAMGMKLNDFG